MGPDVTKLRYDSVVWPTVGTVCLESRGRTIGSLERVDRADACGQAWKTG